MARPADSSRFESSGRILPASEIALIREVVATCRGLSHKELDNTFRELVGWTRAKGSLKEAECMMLLTRLEAAGLHRLPTKHETRPAGSASSIQPAGADDGWRSAVF